MRNSPLDERRRRVLTEEVLATAAPTTPRRRSPGEESVSEDQSWKVEAMERQPRITELVPQGWVAITLWFLAALAVIAGLEALYFYMPRWSELTTDGRIAAFDLDGEGSLAVWFSSTTLLAAAALAGLIFSVRRHRPDDYHARYRIWVTAALVWLVMSLDETASLHEGFKELMAHATGHRLAGDGSLWWVAPYALVLGYVGIRLVLEMRAHWPSLTALILVGVCYAVAVAAQLQLLLPESGARGVMLEEGCEMLGNVVLVLGMALHLRYVSQPAGEKAKRTKGENTGDGGEARPKVRRVKVETATSGTTSPLGRSDLAPVAPAASAASAPAAKPASVRVDAGHAKGATTPLPAKRPAPAPAPTARGDDDDDQDGLSRAERRAMRRAAKQQDRQRRSA